MKYAIPITILFILTITLTIFTPTNVEAKSYLVEVYNETNKEEQSFKVINSQRAKELLANKYYEREKNNAINENRIQTNLGLQVRNNKAIETNPSIRTMLFQNPRRNNQDSIYIQRQEFLDQIINTNRQTQANRISNGVIIEKGNTLR